MEDYNSLPINITYSFEDKPDTKKTMELFAQGTNFPITKSLAFKNKLGNMDLLIHYPTDAPGLMKGLPTQLAQYKISAGSLKHEALNSTHEFVIKVGNNLNQISVLESAELSEAWVENEKVAIKKQKVPVAEPKKPEGEAGAATEEEKAPEPTAPETEQAYENKEKKKSTFSKVKFDFSSHAIPPTQKTAMKDLEVSLYAEDRKFLDWNLAKNKLEAYSYDLRGNLEQYGSWEHYLEAGPKADIMAKITEYVDWLYGAGENAPLEDFQTRIATLEEVGEKIKERYLFYQTLPEMYNAFGDIKEHIAAKLEEVHWLTEEQVKEVKEKRAVAQEYFNKVKAELKDKPKHLEPGYTIKQL